MKGLSETMVIIVTIVVILVAALVLLTIFGKQLTGAGDTVDALRCDNTCKGLCIAQGKTEGAPQGWDKTDCSKTLSRDCSCAAFKI